MSRRIAVPRKRRTDSGIASPEGQRISEVLTSDEKEALDILCSMSGGSNSTVENTASQLLSLRHSLVNPVDSALWAPKISAPDEDFTDEQSEAILLSIHHSRRPHENRDIYWVHPIDAGCAIGSKEVKIYEEIQAQMEVEEVKPKPLKTNHSLNTLKQKLVSPLKAEPEDEQKVLAWRESLILPIDEQRGPLGEHLTSTGLLLIRGGEESSTRIEYEEASHLAYEAKVKANRTILIHYQLLVDGDRGLIPCDRDGNRLEPGSVSEKQAQHAILKIMLGDAVQQKDWMPDTIDGEGVSMEDPLVWVRTDPKPKKNKKSAMQLAIVRLSEVDAKKQTLGFWRNSPMTPNEPDSTPSEPKVTAKSKGKAKVVEPMNTENTPRRSSRITPSTTLSQMDIVDSQNDDNTLDLTQREADNITKPREQGTATRKSSRLAKAMVSQMSADSMDFILQVDEAADPEPPMVKTGRSPREAPSAIPSPVKGQIKNKDVPKSVAKEPTRRSTRNKG